MQDRVRYKDNDGAGGHDIVGALAKLRVCLLCATECGTKTSVLYLTDLGIPTLCELLSSGWLLCGTECGTKTSVLYLTDLGNGKCTHKLQDLNQVVSVGACDVNPFQASGCKTFKGQIELYAANAEARDAATYVPPAFQKYLEALALGNVTHVLGE